MGGTLYQGLVVHADGRFVADLEMGGGVVRALRMARSDAAEAAGWRDLTGKLVFPGPVVLCRSGMPLAGRGGSPATTVGVPVASLAAPAAPPGDGEPDADAAYAVDAVPIPLLRGLEPELEVLPEAVFGQGCAAFAVDDRILTEPGWDDDLVRVTGHCGATLVVLSDDARVMERSVGGLPLPLDGGRVVLAPADAAGMRAALATALRSGEPGSGIAVAAPAHLLLAEPMAAAEWWPAVRSGTVRMVSLGAEEGVRTASSWRACGGRGSRRGTSRWRSWRRCCAGSRRGSWACRRKGASTRAATPTWRYSTRRPRPLAMKRRKCNPKPRMAPLAARSAARRQRRAVRSCGCCVAGRTPPPRPGRWIGATAVREPL